MSFPNTADLHALAREAMRSRGLDPSFSDAVLAEADRMQPAIGNELPDLRALPWCSIDNDDSRDLDQLTVARQGVDGVNELLVAVADVDAVVHAGSPVDQHAARNTTSVYTAGGVFPMLPERLSTDVTSLNPGEDRVALVIAMRVGPDGAILGHALMRARVRNQLQLTYDGVSAFLADGKAPPVLAEAPRIVENLRQQAGLTASLRLARHAHGALMLDTGETRAVITDGRVEDIRLVQHGPAMDLIEDAMIAANVSIARFLSEHGMPAIRRIVRTPTHWDGIVTLASRAGTTLPPTPDARALAGFLDARRVADPLRFPDLSLAVVKLLGKGQYVLERPGEDAGHFGLAVLSYAHATAPNRRFADLISHRLVKAVLAGRPCPWSEPQLTSLADHLSAQEDAATRVERQLRKSAAALLLRDRIGAEFPALVTGVTTSGTWVRTLAPPPVEGRMLAGAGGLRVGDQLRVRLESVSVERGFIDFSRI